MSKLLPVGTIRRGMTLVAYAVRSAPEGCAGGFYGYATTEAQAREMVTGRYLEASQYDTARSAGHCGGMTAPTLDAGEVEDEEPAAWLTEDDCVCYVWGPTPADE